MVTIITHNPAGIAQLEERYLSLCSDSTTGEEEDIKDNIFFVPNFYYTDDLEKDNLTAGDAYGPPYIAGKDEYLYQPHRPELHLQVLKESL